MKKKQLQELEHFLSSTPAPSAHPRITTVFDISGISNQENTFNNWYMYFLDSNKGHPYSGLFLEALLNRLKLKGTHLTIPSVWKVEREVRVSQKRIDLVVESKDDDLCIVIESKINARINNPFEVYQRYGTKADLTVGVLLTLKPNSASTFVNVTHKEWMEEIKAKVVAENSEYYFFLKQFFQGISNLYKDSSMNQQVLFYLQNREKVLQCIQTHEATLTYVLQQLKAVETAFPLTLSLSQDKYFQYFLPDFKDACIVVHVEDLDDEWDGGVNIYLQLRKNAFHHRSQIDKKLKRFFKGKELTLRPNGEKQTTYFLYASKSYDYDIEYTFSHLEELVLKDIKTTFLPMLQDVKSVVNLAKA